MSKYSVQQQPVEILLHWIKSGEIAILEIQRSFFWKAAKVCDFVNSLYRAYPVAYMITWRNLDVKFEGDEFSRAQKIHHRWAAIHGSEDQSKG